MAAFVSDVSGGLSTQQRQALEKAKEQITKVLQKDSKVSERDIGDVFQKQVRSRQLKVKGFQSQTDLLTRGLCPGANQRRMHVR